MSFRPVDTPSAESRNQSPSLSSNPGRLEPTADPAGGCGASDADGGGSPAGGACDCASAISAKEPSSSAAAKAAPRYLAENLAIAVSGIGSAYAVTRSEERADNRRSRLKTASRRR